MIHKIARKKLKIDQHEPPAPHVAPAVLLLL